MKKLLLLIGMLGVGGGAFVAWWRRNPRAGAAWVNRVANPWLVRRGAPERSRGEIALLEHVGRTSGTVRVTLVHPVSVPGGFRIDVPLGTASQWAKNVLAAGHCRLQIGDAIHELDEPKLVPATEVDGLPPFVARVMDWLGYRYLRLHQFDEHRGSLTSSAVEREESPVVETAVVV